MTKYDGLIINKLLDKYERSKSFTGDNKVNQKFSVKVSSLFSGYMDHSDYELFQSVNESIDILVRKQLVRAAANSSKVYSEVVLNLDSLEQAYAYIGRCPKKEINMAAAELLERYKNRNVILKNYCETQLERISLNKSIQHFNDDMQELENILISVDEMVRVDAETFVRDFSIRVFKDSKSFEGICSKVINLMYEYGDFPDKEQVLGNCNIVKNPTYVNFKGAGIVTIQEQVINLSKLKGDIAISSAMISDIERVAVTGKAVITIENLTSFHTFDNNDMLAIYLGGYHNSIRREFIKRIYNQNPGVSFYHFGDIDAGGFYIFEHLKQQTGVNFLPYKMDLETLKAYEVYWKKLTENDCIRLQRIKDSQFCEVVGYMLENNCKLEQEAINIKL